MFKVLRQVGIASIAAAIFSSPAFGAWLDPCTTARLVASWKQQGLWRTAAVYDPPRSNYGHRVRYVGRLRAAGRIYRIYFDQNSDPETAAHHGHSDVVVTTAGGKFLGLYDVTEAEPVRIVGPNILFNSKKQDGDRIHFGRKGPPEGVYLDGLFPAFATAAEFRKAFSHETPWPPLRPRIDTYCRR